MEHLQHAIDHFLSSFNSVSRYIKLIPVHFNPADKVFRFRVILDVQDRYLDNNTYQNGSNIVHPSEEFYNEVNVFAEKHLGDLAHWNNVRQDAWAVVKPKEWFPTPYMTNEKDD